MVSSIPIKVLADPGVARCPGNIADSDDNWKDSQQAEMQASGKAPPNDNESALLQCVPLATAPPSCAEKQYDRQRPGRSLSCHRSAGIRKRLAFVTVVERRDELPLVLDAQNRVPRFAWLVLTFVLKLTLLQGGGHIRFLSSFRPRHSCRRVIQCRSDSDHFQCVIPITNGGPLLLVASS